MKFKFSILILLFTVGLFAQESDVTITDSTVVIHTQGRDYPAPIIDSLGVDSAYQVATLSAVSDWQSSKDAGEKLQTKGRDKVKTANKAIKELLRKADKAKRKGAKKVITVKLDADMVAGGVPVESDQSVMKEIIKKRNYKSADAVADDFKRTAGVKQLVTELGLPTNGNKSAIALRIFNFVNS